MKLETIRNRPYYLKTGGGRLILRSSDLKIVEKPEIKIKENEAKGGSNMEIKLDVNAMIQIKALDDALDDENAEPKK